MEFGANLPIGMNVQQAVAEAHTAEPGCVIVPHLNMVAENALLMDQLPLNLKHVILTHAQVCLYI